MKEINPDFEIVMATYNGSQFLNEQIGSIIQSLENGRLLIHDDGSSDNTLEIAETWASKDSRIKIIYGPSQGGASRNFSYLLEHTTSPYVFCTDQDDLWQPDKIQTQFEQIKFYENVFGSDTPLLLHSDLNLINREGRIISDSMWNYQNINPRWAEHFNLLLTQNVVTGCTMLVNRSLLDLALPIPDDVTMHDHWLGLVACGQGRVLWMETPTVLYRQHGNNVVGAEKYGIKIVFSRLADYFNGVRRAKGHSEEEKLYATAENYAMRFPTRPETVIASKFSHLKECPLLFRPFAILHGRFFMYGSIKNVIWTIKPSRYLDYFASIFCNRRELK